MKENIIKQLRKQKNTILIASVIMAFAVAVIAALSINGQGYKPIIIMMIAVAYLVFMLINNRHVWNLTKDEVDELLEECRYLRIWK